MIARRPLLGLFLAAPAVIAANRLMPVRLPRPLRALTEADVVFNHDVFDYETELRVWTNYRDHLGSPCRVSSRTPLTGCETPVRVADILAEGKRSLIAFINERRLAA